MAVVQPATMTINEPGPTQGIVGDILQIKFPLFDFPKITAASCSIIPAAIQATLMPKHHSCTSGQP